MAVDRTYTGTASDRNTQFFEYVSGFNIAETAGSTAVVKLRDSIKPGTAPTGCTDGAAGNVTVGLHMIAVTAVTRHGESLLGSLLEFTAAGSKKAEITGIPTFPVDTNLNDRSTIGTELSGRRIYVTKAGAPATTVRPSTAQWFLISADASSTLASGENNKYLEYETTLSLADASGFATSGKCLVTTDRGPQVVTYTGKSTNDLTGCTTNGGGIMATGNAVTATLLPDNTTTTFSWNVADGSLTSTNAPTKDTSGPVFERINLAANESVGHAYDNPVRLLNDGGCAVEVTSGTVAWAVKGA